jgi:hypothetical protein
LSKNTKHKVKQDKIKNPIRTYKSYLSLFGQGCDISIEDKANENNNSGSWFAFSYEVPNGMNEE